MTSIISVDGVVQIGVILFLFVVCYVSFKLIVPCVLFDSGRKIKLFLKNNAVVIDVRNKKDYDKGCLKYSVNVEAKIMKKEEFRKKVFNEKSEYYIVVSQNGYLAVSVCNMLRKDGLPHVINGGGIARMAKYIPFTKPKIKDD